MRGFENGINCEECVQGAFNYETLGGFGPCYGCDNGSLFEQKDNTQIALDRLKKEAKKYGYRLVKRTPHVKLKPCTCGRKQLGEWWNSKTHEWFYRCPVCGLQAPGDKHCIKARIKWNEMIEKELNNGD